MPSRQAASKELAEIYKILAHPDRIRLIEELRSTEIDVNTLAELLSLPGPRVSQHLSLLKAHRLVEERREGRRHLYHLVQPELASWIVEGLSFVEGRIEAVSKSSIETARELWSTPERKTASDSK
ncbi:MAG: metalloregulator ArsR/SmtB family transcription factor [Pseudomonadota bacterium]